MTTETLFHYSPENGEWLWSQEAAPHPQLGTIEMVAFSTLKQKPETGQFEVAVFRDVNGKAPLLERDGEWKVLPDHRGRSLWDAGGDPIQITEIGAIPPDDATDIDPGPKISQVRALQLRVIEKACEADIVAGFTSAALGEEHTYPSKLTDQANLAASVSVSREPYLPEGWYAPFWCVDAEGAWEYRHHTAEQIRRVGMDGYLSNLAKLQRKGQLEAQINEAATPEEVVAITW